MQNKDKIIKTEQNYNGDWNKREENKTLKKLKFKKQSIQKLDPAYTLCFNILVVCQHIRQFMSHQVGACGTYKD